MRLGAWAFLLVTCLALAGCGPQLGSLQRGEQGRVARVINGDTLELDSGLRVFLAEIDAPRGDQPYGAQAAAELEALALHRTVLLAYGGTRRWTRRPRDGQQSTQPAGQADTAAIAHVFVESEGGRWFWLQNALVARGAAMVRPRYDNNARTPALMNTEAQARAASRGLWALSDYRPLTVRTAATLAARNNTTCTQGNAPYRLVQGVIHDAQVLDRRASLNMDGAPDGKTFAIVLFGDSFSHWTGPALTSLAGANVRVRGTLGVFHDQPQTCLDDARQLEILHSSAAPAHPTATRQSPT